MSGPHTVTGYGSFLLVWSVYLGRNPFLWLPVFSEAHSDRGLWGLNIPYRTFNSILGFHLTFPSSAEPTVPESRVLPVELWRVNPQTRAGVRREELSGYTWLERGSEDLAAFYTAFYPFSFFLAHLHSHLHRWLVPPIPRLSGFCGANWLAFVFPPLLVDFFSFLVCWDTS